jgi:hypothetical protein
MALTCLRTAALMCLAVGDSIHFFIIACGMLVIGWCEPKRPSLGWASIDNESTLLVHFHIPHLQVFACGPTCPAFLLEVCDKCVHRSWVTDMFRA